MQRINVSERPNLIHIAAEHSLEYNLNSGITGWDETVYYQFTAGQIENEFIGPVEEIERLCFEVVERVVNDETLLSKLGIAETYWDYIADSWHGNERNLYGRMDLTYDGSTSPKLLEYNADTPTALYETAVFQWEWLEQAAELSFIPKNIDQFNEVHECILRALPQMGIEGLAHFACNKEIEDDKGTLDYLEECAQESGLETCSISMSDIGSDEHGRFIDLEDRVITTMFKMYPWEWIMDEVFASHLPTCGVQFIEPPWKSIISNKGLMPLLWEMFQGHQNLLPAFFDRDPAANELIESGNYVRKPLLSRQGANIEIIANHKQLLSSDGPYDRDAHIVQAFHPLPDFSGKYPLVGCWLVASKAAGLCIREDNSLITGENSRVVPHLVLN